MLRHIFKYSCARLSRGRVMQSGLWHQIQSFISTVIRLSMLQNFLLITKTSFSFVVFLSNFEVSVTTWKWNLGQMHLLFHLFRLYCCAPREISSNCSYRPTVIELGHEWEASGLQSLQLRSRTSRFVYDAMVNNFDSRHKVKLKLWSYRKLPVHLHPEHFTIAHSLHLAFQVESQKLRNAQQCLPLPTSHEIRSRQSERDDRLVSSFITILQRLKLVLASFPCS